MLPEKILGVYALLVVVYVLVGNFYVVYRYLLSISHYFVRFLKGFK